MSETGNATENATENKYQFVKRWTMPRDYFGASWPEYYSAGVGQSRDSSALERSNFIAMLNDLGGETGEDENGVSMVRVVREGHWAVGWVEWIAIHESNTKALEIAEHNLERLEGYPVLDEEAFTRIEDEDCELVWKGMSEKERLEYLRRHLDSSAWRNNYRDLYRTARRAVKGEWFAASELLPDPSGILY
jgi:hypothetical protein